MPCMQDHAYSQMQNGIEIMFFCEVYQLKKKKTFFLKSVYLNWQCKNITVELEN